MTPDFDNQIMSSSNLGSLPTTSFTVKVDELFSSKTLELLARTNHCPSFIYPSLCLPVHGCLAFVKGNNGTSAKYIQLIVFEHARSCMNVNVDESDHWPVSFQEPWSPRIINLLHRSESDLTDLTFSVPVPVNSFLIPILRQSPALQKLNIFVDADTAGDVFRVLTLAERYVPNLKMLRIEDVPCRGAASGLLLEGDAFHEMVRSRFSGDSHLETLKLSLKTTWSPQELLIPIAWNSPLRDLVKMKEEWLDVQFLLDLKDCLLEGEAHTLFFGSS
ncbi:hypothetical protein ARMGADRAFT_1038731 [Armillaria gallica]|uniref:Uncharacterized protein n=1 Tax=Armillaria gallica TaxID=47427 RepID=A0A2H3CGS5_ARMGA|nr:hypothetical protein ARMGADRAFT_1038731 [Armillaria gallica]